MRANWISAGVTWTAFAVSIAICLSVLFRRHSTSPNEPAPAFAPQDNVDDSRVFAREGQARDVPPQVRGAYCGLYCVHAACHLLGNTGVEFSDLLEQKYIGSRAGSSAQEIVRCAEDHELHAYAASPVSIASIRAAQGPVVLHVKADTGADTYSHWVLYLGESVGAAQVYSGPSNVTAMSFAELSTLWDGTAIFLSDSEPSRLRIWSPSIAQFLMWVAITAVVIAAIQTTLRRRHVPLMVELPLFLSLPIILTTAYHVFGHSGFARCPAIVESIERFHVADLAPRLTLSDLEALQRDGERSVVVVDARLPTDFATAHLPGAINIPPTASESQVSAALATVSRAATVCVYCQSANCGFDEAVRGACRMTAGMTYASFTRGGRSGVLRKPLASPPRARDDDYSVITSASTVHRDSRVPHPGDRCWLYPCLRRSFQDTTAVRLSTRRVHVPGV
jgi:rhodanese-related sulfurtransferase